MGWLVGWLVITSCQQRQVLFRCRTARKNGRQEKNKLLSRKVVFCTQRQGERGRGEGGKGGGRLGGGAHDVSSQKRNLCFSTDWLTPENRQHDRVRQSRAGQGKAGRFMRYTWYNSNYYIVFFKRVITGLLAISLAAHEYSIQMIPVVNTRYRVLVADRGSPYY